MNNDELEMLQLARDNDENTRRIAQALERIADVLEAAGRPPFVRTVEASPFQIDDDC